MVARGVAPMREGPDLGVLGSTAVGWLAMLLLVLQGHRRAATGSSGRTASIARDSNFVHVHHEAIRHDLQYHIHMYKFATG